MTSMKVKSGLWKSWKTSQMTIKFKSWQEETTQSCTYGRIPHRKLETVFWKTTKLNNNKESKLINCFMMASFWKPQSWPLKTIIPNFSSPLSIKFSPCSRMMKTWMKSHLRTEDLWLLRKKRMNKKRKSASLINNWDHLLRSCLNLMPIDSWMFCTWWLQQWKITDQPKHFSWHCSRQFH